MKNLKNAIAGTDWRLLQVQKNVLFVLAETQHGQQTKDALNGILNFLDAISDAVINDGLVSEETVFPNDNIDFPELSEEEEQHRQKDMAMEQGDAYDEKEELKIGGMQTISFKNHGNDLFAEFDCTCPNPKYLSDPALSMLFKTKLSLSGYNDSYFFDVVNKEPRPCKCPNCGNEYHYQWFRDRIVITKLL